MVAMRRGEDGAVDSSGCQAEIKDVTVVEVGGEGLYYPGVRENFGEKGGGHCFSDFRSLELAYGNRKCLLALLITFAGQPLVAEGDRACDEGRRGCEEKNEAFNNVHAT
jgi:hypothetical protein